MIFFVAAKAKFAAANAIIAINSKHMNHLISGISSVKILVITANTYIKVVRNAIVGICLILFPPYD